MMQTMSACCYQAEESRGVRVVHGSRMGIMRKALRRALQQDPHVESVAESPRNEGGGGATVVELMR